ncbi:MAG: glycoside hydrolase family 1 [Opitutales bacterium]|nr:glycoside hydrolase family 1 [Opitutales bacterium]
MSTTEFIIREARLEDTRRGVVELSRDWVDKKDPPMRLRTSRDPGKISWRRMDPAGWALRSGFTAFGRRLFFVWDPRHAPWVGPDEEIFVAGDFTGWADAVLSDRWQLRRQEWFGQAAAVLELRVQPGFLKKGYRFKFVTGEGQWLPVPRESANWEQDEEGNENYRLEAERTGAHTFAFEAERDIFLDEQLAVEWEGEEDVDPYALWPNQVFTKALDTGPLGAIPDGEGTLFRVFAPRAGQVWVSCFASLREKNKAEKVPLERDGSLCWKIHLPGSHEGWFYWFHAEGPEGQWSHFDPEHPILDPYARATVGPKGPGIIVSDQSLLFDFSPFQPPFWHDLTIVEAHVRDLAAKAPVKMKKREREGFVGLRKWVEADDFYLSELGTNAVELQPLQENDAVRRSEYHWGYMTINYFAPESSYSMRPEKASGIRELQEMVEAFHRRGQAVIVDVVYNHVGVPGHLLYLDKYYYFELAPDGSLENWSGCGNDLRTSAAMTRRLILDSLEYWVKVFNVDGFRFDLGELVGVETLREVEKHLKAIKPGIILIAEPWSFRGHIAQALRSTGFSSWNDGFRDFVLEYLREEGNHDGLRYFLTGSPDHFAAWPAQTVNYCESHDDYTWIDRITENDDHNGRHPTDMDRRRSHLMAAMIMGSVGIPMFHAGQDYLHSKEGDHNTYQKGHLNEIDYQLMKERGDSHRYFAHWIRFRLSPAGRSLRLSRRPADNFFRFYYGDGNSAMAVHFNANGEIPGPQLLLAINPHSHPVHLGWGEDPQSWRLQADADRFFWDEESEESGALLTHEAIQLGPVECGLWVKEPN